MKQESQEVDCVVDVVDVVDVPLEQPVGNYQPLVSRSPMMQQWDACKKQVGEAGEAGETLLLFRLGDFYEAFEEDAQLLSRLLGLTLTKRQGVPMAGIPCSTCETYVDRLVAQGYRVAVAEQMEDPKMAKGLLQRAIARVVTPGSCLTSSRLEEKVSHYFAALMQIGQRYGFALLDLSTGEFRVSELETLEALQSEICRFGPSELLIPRNFHSKHDMFFKELRARYSFVVTAIDAWQFDCAMTYRFLLDHFHLHTLEGLGLRGFSAGVHAAGALLRHVRDGLMLPIGHVHTLSPYQICDYLVIDAQTQRHLELITSVQDGVKRPTLLRLLDRTCTPMGGRLLARWLCQPLASLTEIVRRHEAVEEWMMHPSLMRDLQALLERVRDLERLMGKIQTGLAVPRDYASLRDACLPLKDLIARMNQVYCSLLCEQREHMHPMSELVELLSHALVDEPPLRLGEGKIFRPGYNEELDRWRHLSADSQGWMTHYQTRLREETGIKTLKVGYSRLAGYHIEVSIGQAERMPAQFMRRQTLTNAQRYITPELKEYEEKVLHAEEKLASLESELFSQLRLMVLTHCYPLLETARAIGVVDVLLSLAQVAQTQGYVRPTMHEGRGLHITQGRHAVIESLSLGEKFVANDTHLDGELQRLFVITGPNMAGKSTYLRQVALIVILAQMGGFVPAERAEIGIVDRLFTRIGASDDLARGQSTFMVEMTETSHILHSATDRSLVILDEIGRGTSTYDGISIAWAVAEYLLTTPGCQPKTLFATHYGELTELATTQPAVLNYHVAVQECEDRVCFLRKILPGIADKSYGIHVGALAGLPQPVLVRAREILQALEGSSHFKSHASSSHFVKKMPPLRPQKPNQKTELGSEKGQGQGQGQKQEIQLTFFSKK